MSTTITDITKGNRQEAADARRTSKADIAAAIGMPPQALATTTLKLSDLINTPRYEIDRER